jgi:hypothetical protein
MNILGATASGHPTHEVTLRRVIQLAAWQPLNKEHTA